MKDKSLPKSATEYILWSLVPYSEPNLKLAFMPHLFFNDLERISYKKRQSLRNAYYKAIKNGLVEMDDRNVPRLTNKGRSKIKPYKPKHLDNKASLIVMFDIPESERTKRSHLRLLLKELSFRQIQKSVWASEYDHRDYLQSEIKQYNLQDYVKVYEAHELKNTSK